MDLAGRGWLASVVMLGLISFAVVVLFLCEILALGATELECGAEPEEPPIYVGPARQRGGNTSHTHPQGVEGWGTPLGVEWSSGLDHLVL